MLLSQSGKILPKKVIEKVQELAPAEDELYKRQDDISVARLFADVFKEVARYNVTAKAWYVYDGIRWKEDKGSMFVEQFAKLLTRSLIIYASKLEDERYTNFVAKLQDRRKREIMIKDARDFNFVRQEDFDTDAYLFNCQNCVVNLRTLEHMDHNPDLLLSKVSNVFYDENATSPLFESFISEVLCGDRSKIEYLQELSGYALTGENTQEEAYFVYGPLTRNGKSTFLDTLEHLFGDYAMNCQPETLAQKERNSRQASGDIARLAGTRLLHCGEPPKRMRLDEALLKNLTGRDVVTARFLNEGEFQFIPVFKLFVNTNYLPLVTDDSLFASDRVKVIMFPRHFEPEEQDIHLKSKLQNRENISGIFNWCLAGLRRYLDRNECLIVPEAVRKDTGEYRNNSDKLKQFMTDCLLPNSSYTVPAKKVYEVYQAWCQDNGYGTENKANFLDELRSKNLLSATGTIDGRTVHNVVKGFFLDESLLFKDSGTHSDAIPF